MVSDTCGRTKDGILIQTFILLFDKKCFPYGFCRGVAAWSEAIRSVAPAFSRKGYGFYRAVSLNERFDIFDPENIVGGADKLFDPGIIGKKL